MNYFESYIGGVEIDSNLIRNNYTESDEKKTESHGFHIELNVPDSDGRDFWAAVYAYILAKYNCQDESLFFMEGLPIYINVDEKVASSDYIKKTADVIKNTLKNKALWNSDESAKYGLNPDVTFSYSENADAKPNTESNIDLTVVKNGGSFDVLLSYKSYLYESKYMEIFFEAIKCVAYEMTFGKPLCEMKLTSVMDEQLLDSFNATEVPLDHSLSTVDYFEKQVAARPNATAIVYKERSVTYLEMKRQTDKIASYIKSKGIGKNDFVAILLDRSEMMPIAAWGVIKAGAGFQPLDPTYPQERLNFMCADSDARLVITNRELRPVINEYQGDVLYVDEIESLPEAPDFVSKIDPDNAFVIIYTSGTTGTPKGCVLENNNVTTFFDAHRKVMNFTSKSRVASYASFGFDAGVMDLTAPIMAGATLYIIPDEMRLDLSQMEKFYIDNKITTGFMTTQVGRMFAEHTHCTTLKDFQAGGEKLTPFKPQPTLTFNNCYGPSETTMYVTGYVVKDDSQLQPIGKPLQNVKLYIIDKYKRLLPIGACGELCIAGRQVGRGYYKRPEKTSEVFIKNPFSSDKDYERMYRTGDIVRYLSDGNVDFVGRRDGQVKIRGFRVELTEVEQVIRSFNGIKNATVQAFDHPSGGKFIAAYIVSDVKINIDELNNFIKERKPAYMVPAVTMQIEKIPLNVNGKVAKRELPKPEAKSSDTTKPETESQQKLFDIVSEVLGNSEFGINTDIFEAGLTSIGSIKLNALISDRLGVTLQIMDLKENSTIKSLDRLIQQAEPDKEFEMLPDYPLTKTQEGIFSECMANPQGTAYNLPMLFKINGKIDAEKLRDAVVAVIEAHPYLKTRISLSDSGDVRLRRLDTDTQAVITGVQMVSTASVEDIKPGLLKPFALMGGQLFRFQIIEAAEGVFLFADIHHIIADGASFDILLEDITKAYSGITLEKEKFSGFEKSLIEEDARKGATLTKAKEYYERLLSGFEEKCLPGSDLPSSDEKKTGYIEFNAPAASAIKELCGRYKVSQNGFFTAAFGYTLAKFNALDYSVFATIYNGRGDSRFERAITMLVKTLPVVCNLEGKSSVKEYVAEIANQLTDSMANDIYSFGEICHDLGTNSDVLFAYQGENFKFNSLCGYPSEMKEVAPTSVMEPILVQVFIDADNINIQCQYRSDWFSTELINSLINSYIKTLQEFATKDSLDKVSITDKKALEFWEKVNATEYPYNESETVLDYLEKSVKAAPDKTAVVCGDKQFTYREFDDLTNRLAHYIQGKNIGRDEFVSILIGRNEYMPITAWGTLKAGAAYQPLDPTYPKERLNFMITDSEARLLIADRDLRDMLSDYHGDVLYTDEIESLPQCEKVKAECTPDSALIIIYTSGTTGTPKGCILEHKNLVCFYQHHKEAAALCPESRVATYASFGFDAGMMDIITTFMVGATLYVIPTDIRLDLQKMDRYFIENNIDTGFMTTQVGRMFAENTQCKTLRHFLVGGEKLTPFTPPSWLEFINVYGPTETTVYVTENRVIDNDKLQPIGGANKNTKLYVIDKQGRLLPPLACGELCVAGNQVGRGYFKRPEKTAEVFVKNPFCSDKGYEKMYRTGDIVRILSDGRIDFVGRRDGQVKIRGFRVELTEVEQVIRSFKDIKNATVQAFDSPSGGKFIAAYIVSDKKIDIDELNGYIGAQKPPYMIPAVTMQIDAIPLNVNSKVDKRKLPAPQQQERKAGAEAKSDLEKTICDIFKNVLKCESVYADDNFFEIGGSSISAAKVVLLCMEKGLQVVYKNIFDNPTPEKLARFIGGETSSANTSSAVSEADIKANTEATSATDADPALSYNTIANLDKISHTDIEDVLLVGATGFLGMHVLRELLSLPKRKIYCLVRGGKTESAESRLKVMAMYYFGGLIKEDALSGIEVIDSDITDSALTEKLSGCKVQTIINCAACVKHFDAGDLLERVNVEGVKNLIELSLKTGSKLIQISTLSVAGESVNDSIPAWKKIKENMLYFGQSLENKYIRTKFDAEKAIIEAQKRGLKAKIIRVGNLMSRWHDGEFQINSSTNGFMNRLKAYNALGCFSVEDLDTPVEFSPIDMTAKAAVLLAGTPDEFTVFHANNCHIVHFANILDAMQRQGFSIDVVTGGEFEKRMRDGLMDSSRNIEVSALISYMSNSGEIRREIDADNTFTVKALYRLGFSWPLIDTEYIETAIEKLKTLRFFKKR